MTMDAKGRAGIRRQNKLPNREALKIAMKSVRIRLWRSCITVAGIVLAIAFLASVLVGGVVTKSVARASFEPGDMSSGHTEVQVWLTAISLLVCVVGITNAMLMSVTERFREIGTMKCLGALDWFVIKLFLFEAGMLGLAGSLVGVVLGTMFAVLAGMAQHEGLLARLAWGEVLLRVLVAVVIGSALTVVGAIYPARRAGKMPPADAMRTEM